MRARAAVSAAPFTDLTARGARVDDRVVRPFAVRARRLRDVRDLVIDAAVFGEATARPRIVPARTSEGEKLE